MAYKQHIKGRFKKGNNANPSGRPPKPEIVRFMLKVHKVGECWEWEGAPAGKYGQFRKSRQNLWKMVGAHRFSYEYFVGSVPDGLDVLHKCDNPPCVNPKHLFLGTDLENQRDKWEKGRGKRMTGKLNGMYGAIPWNLGKSWSKEVRKKISRAAQRRHHAS